MQAWCMNITWEIPFLRSLCVKMVVWRHFYKRSTLTLDHQVLVSIQQFSFFSSSHDSTACLRCFFPPQTVDLVPFSHQMKTTCQGRLVAMHPFQCFLLNATRKKRWAWSLLCRKAESVGGLLSKLTKHVRWVLEESCLCRLLEKGPKLSKNSWQVIRWAISLLLIFTGWQIQVVPNPAGRGATEILSATKSHQYVLFCSFSVNKYSLDLL